MSENIFALAQGTVLNHYRIETVLGQGGFGVVYKAHHAHLNEQVVIKEFLPAELAGRLGNSVMPHGTSKQGLYDDCLHRFMEEGRTLVKLRHPNIVRCRDLFTANGTAYLVMDFEDGLPLDELVRSLEAQSSRYTEQQLLHFLLPLAEGLAYIHSQGVLHRDIKPANVFIRRSDGSPVIIDFGAAKQNFALASQSQAPFTEFYAPLEQIQGDGEAQPTVDIHAFGGLMYRLATGQMGPKSEARAMALVYGKPDPLPKTTEQIKGQYSEAFLTTIDKCLAFKAGERPQSMDVVKAMLSAPEETPAKVMENKPSLSALDDLIALAGADSVITDNEMTMLLNKATGLGISNEKAQQYIVQQAVSKGWQLTSATKPSASRQSEVNDFADIFADVFPDFFGDKTEQSNLLSLDIQTELKIPLASILQEHKQTLQFLRKEYCQLCASQGQYSPVWQSCASCQGVGTVAMTKGFFHVEHRCEQCDGRGKVPQYQCQHCHDRGYSEHRVTLEVKIPKGMPDGGRLRLKGQGHRISQNQQTEAGDVYFTVRYAEQSEFEVSGIDLYTVVRVKSLPKPGSSLTVNSLTGPIDIKIPEGYKGEQIRIAGYGLPNDQTSDCRGNWYVNFQTIVDSRQG